LRSSSTDQLIVPSSAFPVAGAYIWNGLPADVTSAPSLPVFRKRLKTVLFSRNIRSSEHVLSELCLPSLTVVLAVFSYLGHLKKFCHDDDDDDGVTNASLDPWCSNKYIISLTVSRCPRARYCKITEHCRTSWHSAE